VKNKNFEGKIGLIFDYDLYIFLGENI